MLSVLSLHDPVFQKGDFRDFFQRHLADAATAAAM